MASQSHRCSLLVIGSWLEGGSSSETLEPGTLSIVPFHQAVSRDA